MTRPEIFDLESDLPPVGARVTGVVRTEGMVAALPSRDWEFTEHGWTTFDGTGRPELVARAFTPAGRAVTRLWLAAS